MTDFAAWEASVTEKLDAAEETLTSQPDSEARRLGLLILFDLRIRTLREVQDIAVQARRIDKRLDSLDI